MALNIIPATHQVLYIAPERTFAIDYSPASVKAIIEQYETDETTKEIALAIASAESDYYYNAKNPNSTAKGVFQILEGTWEEQCEGDPYNPEDNIACGIKMLENQDYWRWSESQPVWFQDISTSTREMIIEQCNCGIFARNRGLNFKPVEYVEELEPNGRPMIGGGVLFTYGHLAVITKIEEDGFWIIESNYRRCKVSERFIKWGDNTIKGFIGSSS